MCQMDYNGICSKCGKFSCDCGCQPIYSSNKCSMCGNTNTLLEPCNCNKQVVFDFTLSGYKDSGVVTASSETILGTGNKISTGTIELDTNSALEDLYNDLGKIRWIGTDEGWDKAIEAVRAHIRAKL